MSPEKRWRYAQSRVYMALGAIVVGWCLYRLIRVLTAAATIVGAAARKPAAIDVLPSGWRFAATHRVLVGSAVLVVGAAALLLAHGVLSRRPWARPVAIAVLALFVVAGLAVAVLQLVGLLRGPGPEADEIGYAHILSFWRFLGVFAGAGIALFSAAALARLSSERMRREFEARPPL